MDSKKKIPLSVPNLGADVMDMLKDCVDSGWISTGGKYLKEFEELVTSYTKIPYGVALHSGTAGLHLSLRYLGVERNDEILVPTVTFIAAVNPVIYMGAEPVFMDCDDTLNMDLDKVEQFLQEECEIQGDQLINKSSNRRVKGILLVHVFGNPIDLERVQQIKKKYNLFVLEDATEALGSFLEKSDGSLVHCGSIGDLGVFSFNANKIVTSGGGGMVVSQNKDAIDKIRYWANQAKEDNPFFIHDEVGYNYRLSNLHAALGVSQMKQLDRFVETKKGNYLRYKEEIERIPGLELLPFRDGTRPNYWFYSLLVDPEKYGRTRNELMELLEEEGILTRPIWDLIHWQKFYGQKQAYRIEKAPFYVQNILNIPCSTHLEPEDVDIVIKALQRLRQ